jgi:hypothetical protein
LQKYLKERKEKLAERSQEDLPENKTCPKCGETKALEDFNRSSSTLDGRQAYCRDCSRAYDLKRLKKKKKKLAKKSQEDLPESENYDRYSARQKTKYTGPSDRWRVCESCGQRKRLIERHWNLSKKGIYDQSVCRECLIKEVRAEKLGAKYESN